MSHEETNTTERARGSTEVDRALVVRMRGIRKEFSHAPSGGLLARILRGRNASPGHPASHGHVVLDGIDLDVYRGEMLALVGRNGCGKSTLLRILCGIMRPTAGTVETKGRLAPLLALGAGFHADFSGRENARLNASLIGLTDAEIDAKMPSILEFADIGDAIDDPVSTYSSGMFARLAFAVAVASDPDVLIADEILAVGDAAFARKCYARIEELRARGTTILLVTHNAGVVLELCDRAVLLEQGRILEAGVPRDVMRRYNALLFAEGGAGRAPAVEAAGAAGAAGARPDDHYDPSLEVKDPIEYPSSGARIVSVVFRDAEGRRVNRMRLGGEYVAEFRAEFERDAEGVILGIQLRNAAGVTLAGFLSRDGTEGLSARRGEKLTMRIPFRMLLLPGRYFVTAGIRSRLEEQSMHKLVDAIAIEVVSEAVNVHQGYCALATTPAIIERSSTVRE
jgi:lipopolysaccharide transport system ATP-binding protein